MEKKKARRRPKPTHELARSSGAGEPRQAGTAAAVVVAPLYDSDNVSATRSSVRAAVRTTLGKLTAQHKHNRTAARAREAAAAAKAE